MNFATITRIEQETPSALSVYLRPEGQVSYQPGQFITLKLNIEGQPVTRSYSFSSTSESPEWRITIKKITGGLASSHIHEQIEVGDRIEYLGPDGLFTFDSNPKIERHIFVGAGSGITPLFSMLDHALKTISTPITLLYGSRNQKESIFLEHLRLWEREYSQFDLKLFFSNPGLKNILFSKKLPYEKGRISEGFVKKWLSKSKWNPTTTAFYLCGPGNMNSDFKTSLMNLGVPEELIKFEFFSGGISEDENAVEGHADVHVKLEGKDFSVMVQKDQSILDALLDAGYDPPYSCTAGTCCTCIAHMTQGEAKMTRHDALSKKEIKDGFILTCQAKPVSDRVTLTYDLD